MPGSADEEWFVSIYGGRYSDSDLWEILLLQTEIESSDILVLSVGKNIGVYKDRIGFELEGQLAFHSGQQTHEEINAVWTMRWLPFLWDDYIDTSFAFGNGISYATAEPPLEIADNSDHKTSRWLYYMLVELAVSLPGQSQWDLFVRVHHRSGAYGAINGVSGGSNFVGVGIRYGF